MCFVRFFEGWYSYKRFELSHRKTDFVILVFTLLAASYFNERVTPRSASTEVEPSATWLVIGAPRHPTCRVRTRGWTPCFRQLCTDQPAGILSIELAPGRRHHCQPSDVAVFWVDVTMIDVEGSNSVRLLRPEQPRDIPEDQHLVNSFAVAHQLGLLVLRDAGRELRPRRFLMEPMVDLGGQNTQDDRAFRICTGRPLRQSSDPATTLEMVLSGPRTAPNTAMVEDLASIRASRSMPGRASGTGRICCAGLRAWARST